MKTLYAHIVKISSGGILSPENEFEIKEIEIIGENKDNLAINDHSFTTIRKEYCKYSICLDKASICLTTNDSCWGNRISYTLYSFSKKKPQTIKREIEAKIKEKFGFFLNGVDLSIIK